MRIIKANGKEEVYDYDKIVRSLIRVINFKDETACLYLSSCCLW